jgi:hypothetical protein
MESTPVSHDWGIKGLFEAEPPQLSTSSKGKGAITVWLGEKARGDGGTGGLGLEPGLKRLPGKI